MDALSDNSLPLYNRVQVGNLALAHANAMVACLAALETDRVNGTNETWDAYVNASAKVDAVVAELWDACKVLAKS